MQRMPCDLAIFDSTKINYLRFSSFPRFPPPPTTNQVVGSSNLSGRATIRGFVFFEGSPRERFKLRERHTRPHTLSMKILTLLAWVIAAQPAAAQLMKIRPAIAGPILL